MCTKFGPDLLRHAGVFPGRLDFSDFQYNILKGKGLNTCYSATYTSQTRDQQRFTISEVAVEK